MNKNARTHTLTHCKQVHQDKPDGDDESLGIDGKMLNIVLQNDRVVCLGSSSESGKPEDQVIEACFANSAGALIDAGALLAGIGNRNIAEDILARMTEACPYRGVIFFDVALRSWRIRARDGQEWSKSASPIPERECFALFDELRCRGADLKLAYNAVAVVTVGSRMCKDKLMQAAGRMRRLAEGQKLVFAVSSDAAVQIRDMQTRTMTGHEDSDSENPSDGDVGVSDVLNRVENEDRAPVCASGANNTVVKHVQRHTSRVQMQDSSVRPSVLHLLQWVMNNTIQATMEGMVMHAESGLVYATSCDSREFAKIEEILELRDNYSEGIVTRTVCALVEQRAGKFEKKRANVPLCIKSSELIGCIVSMCKELGSDFSREASLYDEECERELEAEQEEEQEQEIQIARTLPRHHFEWAYERIFDAETVASLQFRSSLQRVSDSDSDRVSSSENSLPLLEIMSVSEFLKAKVSTYVDMHKDRLAYIAWPDHVMCTRNFMETVEQKGTPQNATKTEFVLNAYMRLAQVCARVCIHCMHACMYTYKLQVLVENPKSSDKVFYYYYYIYIHTYIYIGKHIHSMPYKRE
jgi:hypothetical protein